MAFQKTIKGQINNAAVDQAYEFIKKILKADYISENDGEKIYFDEYHWVKLMYGSSGQQEVLWILMLAFATILEKNKSLIIIEEPEYLFLFSSHFTAERLSDDSIQFILFLLSHFSKEALCNSPLIHSSNFLQIIHLSPYLLLRIYYCIRKKWRISIQS